MNTDSPNKRKRGKGRVFQRGVTYWIAYYVDGCERRESANTEDRDVAQDLLNRRIVEKEDDRLPAKSKERRKRVADLLDALEKDYTARQKDSAENLKSITKPLRAAFGDRRATSIEKKDLDTYISERREAGYSNNTVNRELRVLRQAYNQQEAIRPPKFPELPKGAIRDVLIEPAGQRRLLAAMVEDVYRDATEFKFATGWRGDEVLTLKWRHVREGSIRLIAENAKTDAARDFPLTGKVAEIIERRAAERVPASAYVFHRKGHPLSYETWRRRWQLAASEVGLGHMEGKRYQGVNLHDCRRAMATESIDAGIDPQVVMALTGHKTNAMLDRYRIIKTETLARAIQRREQYIENRVTESPKVVRLARRQA